GRRGYAQVSAWSLPTLMRCRTAHESTEGRFLMQWLADVSIRRPVFAFVLVLVIAVFGVIGYAKLNVDRLPKIDIPIVQITTRLDGAAPEEMESEVSEKLEEAIGTVAGIDRVEAGAERGGALGVG